MNYSLIKEFYKGLPAARLYWEKQYEEVREHEVSIREPFLIGNLVDALITEPEKIEQDYLLIDGKIPGESYLNLTNHLISVLNENYYDIEKEEDLKEALKIAQQRSEFQRNWGIDAVYKNFNINCKDYFSVVKKALDQEKVLYTSEQKQKAEQLKNTLVDGEYTKQYFRPELKVFNQVELFWRMFNMEFKIKIDRIIVDLETKKITLTDIKTYSENFFKSYIDYYYWLQGIIYNVPLTLYQENVRNEKLFEDSGLELRIKEKDKEILDLIKDGYVIDDTKFIFLTVDKNEKNPPIPFLHTLSPKNTTQDICVKDAYRSRDIDYPGWLVMCSKLYKHITEDQWEYPWPLVENKVIEL